MATTNLGSRAPVGSPPRHPAAAGRRDPRLVLTIGCALLAFAVAALAGRGVRTEVVAPEPTGPRTVVADVGGLRIAADETWRRASLPRALGALAGPRSTVYAPAEGLDVRTILTAGAPADRTLLPSELRSALPEQLPKPERDLLLRMPAWRYDDIRMPGGRLVDVSVVPTTAGSFAFTCVVDGSAWSTSLWCEGGLRSIDLGSARALAPSAALGAQVELPGAVRDLDTRRRPLRAALARAKSRRGQARVAGRLAATYRAATARIAPLAADISTTGAPRRVVRELRGTARSYRRLALAARQGRAGRYRRARAAIRRSDRALAAAIAAIG